LFGREGSRGIIRKEGEEEKKGKREKRSENGRCFWNMQRGGERGGVTGERERRGRERK
jgi:hypothetical protein